VRWSRKPVPPKGGRGFESLPLRQKVMTYIDLTQHFTADIPVYPGDPQPEISQYAFLEKDGYNDFRVNTTMHAGTHIDAPLHFIQGGTKIFEFPPEHFVGRGVIIDARDKEIIDVDILSRVKIETGDIVLFCTGLDKKYHTPAYYESYLNITQGLANKLVQLGIKMVGVDGPSPDQEPFSVHKILLAQNVLIAENLTHLDQLIGLTSLEIIALPVKYDTEAAPARVIARY
jgi:kynurenine formamidase